MKFHLFVLSFVCLSFISCKKERTCSCNVETTGLRNTYSQSAGVSFTLNLGLPLPIPPIQITPAKDTTFSTTFKYSDKSKTNYDKISKRALKKTCQSSFEEDDTQRYSSVVPGSYTVNVTETITRKYSCEIE